MLRPIHFQIVVWSAFTVILSGILAVFFLPTFVSLVLLLICLSMFPVVLVTGVIYSDDDLKAFFIGAAASAVAPYLVVANSAMPRTSFFSYWGFEDFRDDSWGYLVVAWLYCSPLLWGFCGGVAARSVQLRLVGPSQRIVRWQFSLSTLMIGLTIIAAYLGLITAAPIWVVGVVTTLILATVPAALIAGIVYGRKEIQAFSIGGITAGIPPLLLAYGLAFSSPGHWASLYDRGRGPYGNYDLESRIEFAVALFGPPLIIAIGGELARRIRRRLAPPESTNEGLNEKK